ncbi:CoA binding domain-containing protein [Mycena rebaudengoi]|nr:CoA binding domain-containing protein [Mycena rebaudengoi]
MSSIAAQKSALAEKQTLFFSAQKFAVVGASSDPSKFGAKVMTHLLSQNKNVTPINPNETEVQGIPCLKSLSDLPDPKNTSVSIVVPPSATISVLEQAKSVGVFALWLQPGAEDADCVQYIRDNGLETISIYSRVVAVHGLKAAVHTEDDTSPTCLLGDALEHPSAIHDLAINVALPSHTLEAQESPDVKPCLIRDTRKIAGLV